MTKLSRVLTNATLEDFAMWSFLAAIYAMCCAMVIGLSFPMVCAPWPVKAVFVPMFIAALGIWIFATYMIGTVIKEKWEDA